MRNIVLLVLSLLIVVPANLSAGKDSSIKTIIATGYGIGHDQALKNAFKSVIEQQVGVMIDSEVILNNNEIIKNTIFTASSGFIEKYEELSTVDSDNGLTEVRIKANVRVDKLEKRVRSIKKGKMSIDHHKLKNIYAEVTTKAKSKEDRKSIVNNYFNNIITKETFDDILGIKVIDYKIFKDRVKNNRIPVEIYYEINFNHKLYNKIINDLENNLESVGATLKRKTDFPVYKEIRKSLGGYAGSAGATKKASVLYPTSLDVMNYSKIYPDYSVSIIKKSGKKYYVDNWLLPEKIWYNFSTWSKALWDNEIIIELLDEKGEIIGVNNQTVQIRRFFPALVSQGAYRFVESPHSPPKFILAPFLSTSYDMFFEKELTKEIIYVDIEDLKSFKEVSVILR